MDILTRNFRWGGLGKVWEEGEDGKKEGKEGPPKRPLPIDRTPAPNSGTCHVLTRLFTSVTLKKEGGKQIDRRGRFMKT